MRSVGLIFLLAVLGLPALEIYTMFQLAHYIGWWLLAWLLASMILGAALIKEESRAVFGRLALTLHNGQSPFSALWQSGRTMLAGLLLIFPGAISDVIALILLLWPGRPARTANRPMEDADVIEGEVRVFEAELIEIKSDRP